MVYFLSQAHQWNLVQPPGLRRACYDSGRRNHSPGGDYDQRYGGVLPGKGTYGAYLACKLFQTEQKSEVPIPKIMQDGRDGDEEPGYIANITDGVTAGFKYFECGDCKRITITTRGYAAGYFEVKHAWDGRILASIR